MYCEYKDFFSCQNLDRRPLSVCKIAMYLKELKNIPLNRFMDYRLRGAETLFRHLPPVSVFRPSAECSENKNHSEFPLLQTVGKLVVSVVR